MHQDTPPRVERSTPARRALAGHYERGQALPAGLYLGQTLQREAEVTDNEPDEDFLLKTGWSLDAMGKWRKPVCFVGGSNYYTLGLTEAIKMQLRMKVNPK